MEDCLRELSVRARVEGSAEYDCVQRVLQNLIISHGWSKTIFPMPAEARFQRFMFKESCDYFK
jgi:hypothetical protein